MNKIFYKFSYLFFFNCIYKCYICSVALNVFYPLRLKKSLDLIQHSILKSMMIIPFYCLLLGMGEKPSPSVEGFSGPEGLNIILTDLIRRFIVRYALPCLEATFFGGGCDGRIQSGRANRAAEATTFRWWRIHFNI